MRDQGCTAPDREAYHRVLVYARPPLATAMSMLTLPGEYWVVNQILAKQLHNTDADVLRYTTNLMDKLEQVQRPRSALLCHTC